MGNFVKKLKDMWTPPEDDFEYEEELENEDEFDAIDLNKDLDSGDKLYEDARDTVQSTRSSVGASHNSRVVNIHATAQLQVVLSKPTQFGEETRSVADELLKMHTVVLNLENTSKDVSRRILDFLSGVAYANNGKIKRVATSTFIITPYNVDLTGDDLMGELENNGVYF